MGDQEQKELREARKRINDDIDDFIKNNYEEKAGKLTSLPLYAEDGFRISSADIIDQSGIDLKRIQDIKGKLLIDERARVYRYDYQLSFLTTILEIKAQLNKGIKKINNNIPIPLPIFNENDETVSFQGYYKFSALLHRCDFAPMYPKFSLTQVDTILVNQLKDSYKSILVDQVHDLTVISPYHLGYQYVKCAKNKSGVLKYHILSLEDANTTKIEISYNGQDVYLSTGPTGNLQFAELLSHNASYPLIIKADFDSWQKDLPDELCRNKKADILNRFIQITPYWKGQEIDIALSQGNKYIADRFDSVSLGGSPVYTKYLKTVASPGALQFNAPVSISLVSDVNQGTNICNGSMNVYLQKRFQLTDPDGDKVHHVAIAFPFALPVEIKETLGFFKNSRLKVRLPDLAKIVRPNPYQDTPLPTPEMIVLTKEEFDALPSLSFKQPFGPNDKILISAYDRKMWSPVKAYDMNAVCGLSGNK